MRTQRQIVDYSLQKRALLRDVYSGRVGTYEVCDASPYLLSAARFHGELTDQRCPVCRRENLTHVNYIYGDELKQSAGQAHLVEQFLLGRAALEAQDLDAVSAQAAGASRATVRGADSHPRGADKPLSRRTRSQGNAE
jgi:hypothetical protein